MLLKDQPIRKKLMRVIILISGSVLLVTCSAFFFYEYYSFRQKTIQTLSTTGKIIAANSTAALAFANPDDAKEILSALAAEQHIVAASLYDKDGKLFALYPATSSLTNFPAKPEKRGYEFKGSFIDGFAPVIQNNNLLGTLYLKSDLQAMYERFKLYSILTIFVIGLSFLLAYFLSSILQKRISEPITVLAETAKAISEKGDYSVRATKLGEDELGLLTDAFNNMLSQIQQQNYKLNEFNKSLEQKVIERTIDLEFVNKELIESEAQIQSVFNSAPDAVIVIDSDSNVVRWNAQAEIIFGWKADEIIGNPLQNFIIPEKYRERHLNGMKHFFKTGEGPVLNKTIELEALNKSGAEFACALSIAPTQLKGKYLFIAFARDITKSKKAESELKQKSLELSRSNADLEQFAYVASHDLQEPLRTITSYVQLLGKRYKDKLDQDANDFINFAIDGSNRMRNLINSLLEYSRVNRIKPFEHIDMNDLLKDVLQNLANSIKESNANIVADDLPTVYGDLVLIDQLFQNLIGNAIKYKGEKSPEIHVSWKRENGDYLFSIKDNGIGIPKEYSDKIFVIFQRLHGKDKYQGTGIGLAICKKIVERHGGKIWVESEPGKGSTFYFTIKANLKTTKNMEENTKALIA